MRGLLSTRTPQSSDTTSGGMLNPPLPPSTISEATPRGAAGSFTPRVVLSRPAGGGGCVLPLSTWAGRTFADAVFGRTTAHSLVATNSNSPTDDTLMLVFNNFVDDQGTVIENSGFNIGYIAGVLTAWQDLDSEETGFAAVTNITSTTLTIGAFGGAGPTAFTLTAV